MVTAQAMTVVFCILALGLVLFRIAMNLSALVMQKEVSMHSLFKNFGQKMWMTTGLGLLFFGIYLLIVYFLSRVDDPSVRLNFFLMVYRNPIPFIYLGLLFFACVSVGIILVRMVIKYLYNRKF